MSRHAAAGQPIPVRSFYCRTKWCPEGQGQLVASTSAGRARYEFFQQCRDTNDSLKLTDILVRVASVRLVTSGRFREVMRTYGIDFARVGMRVTVDGRPGQITGGDGYMLVMFDGDRFSRPCHPTWRVAYFNDDGTVLKEFTDQKAVSHV